MLEWNSYSREVFCIQQRGESSRKRVEFEDGPAREAVIKKEEAMGLEAVYFLGAVVLLAAMIYGVLSYRYRNRAADRVGDEVTRERYRRNES